MNKELARFNMIEQQIRPWNVLDKRILDVLSVVPREKFVPGGFENFAFADMEIPLARLLPPSVAPETMLSPKVEARLLDAAHIKPYESVLEIGTGSGYMAALMARCARSVLSIDIHSSLVTFARENLKNACIDHVEVVCGDGAQGWPLTAPSTERLFDVIMISGALPVLPEHFLQQLTVGGRVLAIIGEKPIMTATMTTRQTQSHYVTIVLFETLTKLLTFAWPSSFVF